MIANGRFSPFRGADLRPESESTRSEMEDIFPSTEEGTKWGECTDLYPNTQNVSFPFELLQWAGGAISHPS